MSEFRIYGGATPEGQDSLCSTCVFGQTMRGHQKSQEIVRCDVFTNGPVLTVPFVVAECDRYLSRKVMHKVDAEKTGIVLDGTHSRVDGFKK
jgi:hypothetical protein